MTDKDPMTIELASKDFHFTTLLINGLSPKEMDYILAGREDALGEVMEKHGAGDTFRVWKCGYGIYGIRHFGGHLMVEIGNSCD